MTARYDILIPLAEIARMAGVSRQRIFQLAATPGFPRPLHRTGTTYSKRLWSKKAIQKWLRARAR